MTLELYVKPFIFSARHNRLKEPTAARTFDFAQYGVDTGTLGHTASGAYVINPDGAGPAQDFEFTNRDFNFRSLIGNSGFRW
jgi:hypothetical protein